VKRFLPLIALLLTLASCQVLGGGGDDNVAGSNADPRETIYWTRTPETVVFRTDVVGGETAQLFTAKNEIPNCTIYGDNHIIWTNTAGDNSTQILTDIIPDATLYRFFTDLTIADRIYTYTAGANTQPPSTTAPVVETLALNIGGREHITDAFGGWTYPYFESILNRCMALSEAPAIYEPSEAWISAVEVPYDSNRPQRLWDNVASGLDLAQIADGGEPQRITGNNVAIIWALIRGGGAEVQFAQDIRNFNVALQVPNVTRDAPPRPD